MNSNDINNIANQLAHIQLQKEENNEEEILDQLLAKKAQSVHMRLGVMDTKTIDKFLHDEKFKKS